MLADLIDKYNVGGPYYTSYPTLGRWKEDFKQEEYAQALVDFLKDPKEDHAFSLYVHYPYCIKICYFCICNALATSDKSRKQQMLNHICQELDLMGDLFEKHSIKPEIKEIHLGGGTPSYIDEDDFDIFIERLSRFVNLKALDEFAIEIDPRTVQPERMYYYPKKGIQRISFGVQDFDPLIQETVGRVQSLELVKSLLTPEIRKQYRSVNFDFLYGLPKQTRDSFRRTVEITLKEFLPDRITLLRYAHVPHIKKHMKVLKEEDILPETEKIKMFTETVDTLLEHGYEMVGIDNFALKHDDLAKGFNKKTAWRNFVGFTPGRVRHMIGVGPTATSAFGKYYSQSVYPVNEYYKMLEDKRFPILRGYVLSQDDCIRREVIFKTMCDREVYFDQIGKQFGISFHKYFKEEIKALQGLVKDGMVELGKDFFKITEVGKYFVRHVCKVFDAYLKKEPAYKITGP